MPALPTKPNYSQAELDRLTDWIAEVIAEQRIKEIGLSGKYSEFGGANAETEETA
jgi:hypothetical protein